MNEVIILAGGMGSRLRSVVADVPKCLAMVNKKPFISYLILKLTEQGVNHFIFSLGYKSELVIAYLESEFAELKKTYVVEDKPLGTGGAIKKACSKVIGDHVLVVNGDTMFTVNIAELENYHLMKQSDCTLSLKMMENFDRYGVVELNPDQTIKAFREKEFYASGLINGGVYLLNCRAFNNEDLPESFSFEKDYLERYFSKRSVHALVQNEYFIDIGIPEDYAKAQIDFKSIFQLG